MDFVRYFWFSLSTLHSFHSTRALSIHMSMHKQDSTNSICIAEQCKATNMAWAKARKRGKSGHGEDIDKKLNMLLHLLLLFHPREFHRGKHTGIIFRTSMERKLRERHRQSKSSLVSTSILYYLFYIYNKIIKSINIIFFLS